MRRPPRKPKDWGGDRLRLATPLFWRECEKCNWSVRGEPMWKYRWFCMGSDEGDFVTSWLCTACAPKREDAVRYWKGR
jgi:hypothetical protein